MMNNATPPVDKASAAHSREPRLAWSLSPAAWDESIKKMGQPAFRSKQIWSWLYQRKATSWSEMLNLPATLRSELEQRYILDPWVKRQNFADSDGTSKLLLICRDGVSIESVLIPARERLTLCLSTQAGCAMGCLFCATGQMGMGRNLAAGEIVGQYMAAAALTESRISNVVLMGMGEPFANYDASLEAVRILNNPDGISIGARRITISTCGIVPGIWRLAEDPLQVELAVSLHAATDELRSRLMPINTKWPLDKLLPACRYYTKTTGRIITFEYTLIKGLNDTPGQLHSLIQVSRLTGARINLIPLSPVDHFKGQPPSPAACRGFVQRLNAAGVNATLRQSRGAEIGAACGQLSAKVDNRI